MCRITTKLGDGVVTTRQIPGRWISTSSFDGRHVTMYSTSMEAAGKNHLELCWGVRKMKILKSIKDFPNPCNEIPLYPEAPPMKGLPIDWGVFETDCHIRFEGEEPQRDYGGEDDGSPY